MSSGDIAEGSQVQKIVRLALDEDLLTIGDVTTRSLVPPDLMSSATLLAREACVVAGLDVAVAVFHAVDSELTCTPCVADGDQVAAGADLMTIAGAAGSILTAERTALNFMQRMTGIATLTRQFVDAVAGTNTVILDTRKTTPALRCLEKYAVLCGGGQNHRMGLYDRVMIKDNHRRLWGGDGVCALDRAVLQARERYPEVAIEVEVESEAECELALKGKPEWILLDNMTPDDMARCVALVGGRAKLEASGGITLATVTAAASSGVDAISLGCLTHSAPATDLSLEMD